MKDATPIEKIGHYICGQMKRPDGESTQAVFNPAKGEQTGEVSLATVETVADPNELLRQCDVVLTTTTARLPVLTDYSDSSCRARLLICIGSDAPGKTEVAPSILRQAKLRLADSAAQSRQRGEFQGFDGDIVNLGDWIQQKDHTPVDGLVVFDSSGVALQDCVIAQMVYESL